MVNEVVSPPASGCSFRHESVVRDVDGATGEACCSSWNLSERYQTPCENGEAGHILIVISDKGKWLI